MSFLRLLIWLVTRSSMSGWNKKIRQYRHFRLPASLASETGTVNRAIGEWACVVVAVWYV